MERKKIISYSAVVLDDKSRKKLYDTFAKYIDDGYEYIGDHMTLNMGEIDNKYVNMLGLNVGLRVDGFAKNEFVIAVRIGNFDLGDKTPHITIAVNRKNGGKPKMSNDIKEWTPYLRPLILVGTVKEVEYKL
jgi:hypothetical protein